MKKTFAIFFVIGLLISCNSEEKKIIVRKELHKSTSSPKVISNQLLSIEISGMSCVMGCGASIRKELYATKAVSSVEFDFKEGRKTNIATIKFDTSKINLNQIVSLLSTMNENQFTIGKTISNSSIN
jgi:mercuric ion binding protein